MSAQPDSPRDSAISALVAAIAPSATLAVDAAAKAMKAAGEPVIGFGAGEPDFPTPAHIVDAAVEACRDPKNHKYSPAGGLPELKAAIAAKTRRDSGLDVDPATVLVTNGGKHAVYASLLTLVDPGDEVLLPAPYWTTYPEPIRLAGGVPVEVAADETTGFKCTVEMLEAARTPKTKAMIFVSPSNPTGAVYSREETIAIGQWAVEHGIWVITDEIYEHLTYGDHEFTSLPVAVPEIAERCVILNGVAKTYAMTGWRVGWMIGPSAVIKGATNLQSHSTSNVANVSQRCPVLAAVEGPLDAVVEMRKAFDRRRQAMWSLLSGIDGVTCLEPEGAFYAYPNLTGLYGRSFNGRSADNTLDLAAIILEEAKVAIVPGEAFGTPGYARLSFALGDDDLGEGIGRIADLVAGIPMTGGSGEPTPYGEWPSPITASAVVAAAAGVSEIVVDRAGHDRTIGQGASILWAESRPSEGGRIQLVRHRADGTTQDLLPEAISARTRVHEYGGGAWAVSDGTVVFNRWDDQRLWTASIPDAGTVTDLRPLTPEPATHHGFRYADLEIVAAGASGHGSRWVLAVRERHDTGGEAVNEIVAVALDGAVDLDAPAPDAPSPVVVVSGPDFVSNPRVAPDGTQLAWVAWDHPNMPWDTTRICAAPLTWTDTGPSLGPVTVVAGDTDVSSIMPQWSPDGRLHFVTDRTDWWNIVAVGDDGSLHAVTDVRGEVGTPPWVFAMSRYAFLDDGRIAFAYAADGVDHLAIVDAVGTVVDADVGVTEIASVHATGDGVIFVGASFERESTVLALTATTTGSGAGAVRTLRATRRLPAGPDWFPAGRAVSFPSGPDGSRTAHGLYYPPTNPDVTAPDGPPPLLVLIHGGPTAMARARLDLAKAYWTSRGFAIVDVNYGGSTGFGRAYRRLLDDAWGIVDVQDCLAAVEYLIAAGLADPDRLCIRGGSAGGFTVLAAMTNSARFAAGACSYGVSDLSALAEETHKFESRYTDGLIGPYPAAKAIYDQRSPINHLDRLTSPLIVFQGLEDEVVPPNQSERVVEALTERGVPVAYLAFEGEQHGFRRSETVIAVLEAELAFYGAVLGFAPADDVAEPDIVNRRALPARS